MQTFILDSTYLCQFKLTPKFASCLREVFPELGDQLIDVEDDHEWLRVAEGSTGMSTQWWGLFNLTYGGDACEQLTVDELGLPIAFCAIANGQFIYSFGVTTLYRNQGYGSHFLKMLIANLGWNDLFLFVKKSNRIAMRLYRNSGFEYSDSSFVPPVGEICMKRHA